MHVLMTAFWVMSDHHLDWIPSVTNHGLYKAFDIAFAGSKDLASVLVNNLLNNELGFNALFIANFGGRDGIQKCFLPSNRSFRFQVSKRN